jgi:hypothetical protein
MQGVDCADSCRFHNTKFLGVFVCGDTDPHNIEKKRFKSGSGISVLAFGVAPDLG